MLTRLIACCALLGSPALAQHTWTVSPSSSTADFNDLQHAIDTVSPGDALLLSGGWFGSFFLDKPLRILGDPDFPTRCGYVWIHSAPWFELSNVELRSISAVNVPGTSLIDAIEMDPIAGLESTFEAVADLRVTRSEFRPQTISGGIAIPALTIRRHSRVQLVDSVVEGGKGLPLDPVPGRGATALIVEDSDVLLAGTSVLGGDGQDLVLDHQLVGEGAGGTAVRLHSGHLEARGTLGDSIEGGVQNPGDATFDGVAIETDPVSTAQVTVSGVQVGGATLGNVTFVESSPFLKTTGGPDGPGGSRQVELFGAEGSGALVLFSTGATYDASLAPDFGVPLLVDLGEVVATLPAVLTGFDRPVVLELVLPSETFFAGLAVHLQAFAQTPALELGATNSSAVVLSF